MKPNLAVDWDGTCVENVWPGNDGEWMPGAVDALLKLSDLYTIVIHTCRIAPTYPDETTRRSDAEVQHEINTIRERLDDVGLNTSRIHDFRNAPWKPPALAYVDDKAVRYGGRRQSWDNLLTTLTAIYDADAEKYRLTRR